MDLKSFWKSQRSTVISAVIAIVVIAGLFILFNALPAGQPAKPADEEKQEQPEPETAEREKAKEDEKKDKEKVGLPTKYTVVSGDHLWKISERFYGTGSNWTLIAEQNRLANPDVIHSGNEFAIPKADAKISSTGTHTVVTGDTLWDIAHNSYGSGFEWTKIRDANAGKIGTLANGRPLIVPGQVLVIPN